MKKAKTWIAIVIACLCILLIWKIGFAEHLDFEPSFIVADGIDVIHAPFIDQREKYPTGCESVSAVMALQYLGIEITPDEFIDNYLPQGDTPHEDSTGRYVGDDPSKVFLGNPYSEDGWGCYAPVIKRSMEEVVKGNPISVKEYKDKTLEWLCEKYVNEGIPVLIWATIEMVQPDVGGSFFVEDTEKELRWVYPTHCLLLVGQGNDGWYFNDPMAGKAVHYDTVAVERAFSALGMQSVVAVPK